MSPPPSSLAVLFARSSLAEASRIARLLRRETVGGALLLVAAAVALVWANSPWSNSYLQLRDLQLGPEALHLHLSLGAWAADGLLAIFFFVAGLEVKREFVVGDLRDPSRAVLPIIAAVVGVAVPALIFLAVTAHAGEAVLRGWATPTATDIAFALAVLAVVNTHLPLALRTFLLTLAVVDDLIAIAIIAVFYTTELHPTPLLLALLPMAVFGVLAQRRLAPWWALWPLAVCAWALVHASGIHATVGGVLLALLVPVRDSSRYGPGLADHFEHRLRPLSAGIAAPVFAFFAAGVTIGGVEGLKTSLTDPIAVGVVAGLVVGKTVGVFGSTVLVARFTKARLGEDLHWLDILGISLLAGIGFTVSLLIGELSYPREDPGSTAVKVAVLCGSVVAAVLASILLRLRNRSHRLSSEGPQGTQLHRSPHPDR